LQELSIAYLLWLEFTPQTGSEQAGRRPALVISPRAYNAKVGLALFCPVTSRIKGYPFEVALPEGSGVVGVVLADQLKSLDWRARKAKLIASASSDVLAMVTSRILPLLVPNNAALFFGKPPNRQAAKASLSPRGGS
jgi:mRNA interferase MazF